MNKTHNDLLLLPDGGQKISEIAATEEEEMAAEVEKEEEGEAQRDEDEQDAMDGSESICFAALNRQGRKTENNMDREIGEKSWAQWKGRDCTDTTPARR